MTYSRSERQNSRGAFSLLEVVVAIGIFAAGMLGVVALFTPVARSVSASADGEAAARVADALKLKLQSMPFLEVPTLLKVSNGARHALTDSDARSDYNPATDAQILFASRDGSKVGVYSDPVWIDPATNRNSDPDKFFEIALIRNETLSPLIVGVSSAEGDPVPADSDATALMMAYTARVRWPAFVKEGGTGAIQVGSNPAAALRFDHSSKQVLFFTGSVTR
jgi:type II secretory pathway pseudopilin PulG